MTQARVVAGHSLGLFATERRDRWWVAPLITFLGLSAFGCYATWAALQGDHYWYGSYLSPFYSPLLFIDPMAAGSAPIEHAWFGAWPEWWPRFFPSSPAILILAFPLSFRATCYYYRKAYYRAFAATPPGCAVGALPFKDYRGETSLLLIQNLHRVALYFALIFIGILSYDAFASLVRDGRFGIGVGSIVLVINATLLAGYTLGCHSFRHLVGGCLDCFSMGVATKCRYTIWTKVSALNRAHMVWAWTSLFWVGFSDLYIRLVSMGILHDWSTW